jgi:hypothetical protein
MVVSRKSTESDNSSVALVRPSDRADLRSTGFPLTRLLRGLAADVSAGLSGIVRNPCKPPLEMPGIYRDTGAFSLSALLHPGFELVSISVCPTNRLSSKPAEFQNGKLLTTETFRLLKFYVAKVLRTGFNPLFQQVVNQVAEIGVFRIE